MLGKDNWKLAEGLLPPEILKHYEKGEYVNRIIDWPAVGAAFRTSTSPTTMAENIKANRATIAGIQPPSMKDPASDRKVPYEPSFFDFTTLQRFSK